MNEIKEISQEEEKVSEQSTKQTEDKESEISKGNKNKD